MAKEKKTKEEKVKKYSLSEEEKKNIKRIVATIGHYQVVLDGLNYALEAEQRRIEKRCGVGEAPKGHKIYTMIDPIALELHVQTIKIGEQPPKDISNKN